VIHRELDLRDRPDVFYPTLVDELLSSAFDFDLQITVHRSRDDAGQRGNGRMPEKLSSLCDSWTGTRSEPGHFGKREFEKTDALAFNQWRVTESTGHLGKS